MTKKTAYILSLLILSQASAETPAPSSAAKTLALSAVKLLWTPSPVKRSVSLAESAGALADDIVADAGKGLQYRAALHTLDLARLAEQIAVEVLAVKGDSPEDDADLGFAIDSVVAALGKVRPLLEGFGDKRGAATTAISRADSSLQPAIQMIEKRRAKRGGADEGGGKPEDKKPDVKKPDVKKPDEGKPGRPGDY